jgi:hypothetical protein
MQVQPELVRLEHENRSGGGGLDRLMVEAAITVEEAMISATAKGAILMVYSKL